MKSSFIVFIFSTIATLAFSQEKQEYTTIEKYMTVWDGRSKNHLTLQPPQQFDTFRTANINNRIVIIPSEKHQPILGFGSSLMDSDIYHLMRMSDKEREAALRALFDPVDGAGWNLMRIAFGASGWDRDWNFYSFNDMPEGQTDPELENFSVKQHEEYKHFQLYQEILEINPEVKFAAAVWSPPAWMKDSKQLVSKGKVMTQYYEVYAKYLVKSIRAYEARGVPIHSISVQNEPFCDYETKYPQSLYHDWRDLRDVNIAVAKEFQKEKISTELWIYDQNFNAIEDYVLPLMQDESLKGMYQGVAWHLYDGGKGSDIQPVLEEFPDMPMYMTERVAYDIEGMSVIIECMRNDLRCYIQWVTMSDEYDGPYQWAGGSEHIVVPAPQVHQYKALYNLRKAPDIWYTTWAYYNYAQMTKFVQRGAIRIGSTDTNNALKNAAFLNPDGSIVIVIVNTAEEPTSAIVQLYGKITNIDLPEKSTSTLIFR